MRVALKSWHFLATAGVLSAVLVVTYLIFVRGYMGQLIDEAARAGLKLGDGAETAKQILEVVPIASAVLVLVALVVGLARRQVATTVVGAGVVLVSNLASQLLKYELLTRPDNGATGAWHNSFPSGHATVVASAFGMLLLVAPPRARPAIAVVGAGVIAVVGALLVGSQWHRPSDVVGAILVVAITMCLGGAVLARRHPQGGRAATGVTRRQPLARLRTPERVGVAAVMAGTVVVVAAALALAYFTVDGAEGGTAMSSAAGLIAVVATAGASMLVSAVLFRRLA